MELKKRKSHINKNCIVSLTLVKETMHLLSGKWKMQIVAFLINNGKTRFMDIMRGVEGISPKALSKLGYGTSQIPNSKNVIRDLRFKAIFEIDNLLN